MGEALIDAPAARSASTACTSLAPSSSDSPSDRPATFQATVDVANRAELAFAQFVMLTPYPGTVDFQAWEKRLGPDAAQVGGSA